ncbi:MAG TPA: hypothetical protein VGF14_01905 [Alphaproteobacteria bacterium]
MIDIPTLSEKETLAVQVAHGLADYEKDATWHMRSKRNKDVAPGHHRILKDWDQRDKNQFPPDQLYNKRSLADTLNEIALAWDRFTQKPAKYAHLSASEFVAAFINIPTITAKTVDLWSNHKSSLDITPRLARHIDEVFDMNGAFEMHAGVKLAESLEEPEKYRYRVKMIDLPYQMNDNYYKGWMASHARLLTDIMRKHQIDEKELSIFFKIKGIKTSVIQKIVAYHTRPHQQNHATETDTGEPHKLDALVAEMATIGPVMRASDYRKNPGAEPIFSRSVSRAIDEKLFGMAEDGPFTRYFDKRYAEHAYRPIHIQKGVVMAPHKYSDVFPDKDKKRGLTVRERARKNARREFYKNMADITEGRVGDPLSFKKTYDMRLTTAFGWTKPNSKEKEIIAKHPEWQEAGLGEMIGMVEEKSFISQERRKSLFTLSEIHEMGWEFTGQKNHGTESFREAADEYLSFIHAELGKNKKINPDKAMGEVLYPISASSDRHGAPTLYLNPALYDLLIETGTLKRREETPQMLRQKLETV